MPSRPSPALVLISLSLATFAMGCPTPRVSQQYGPERTATISTRPEPGEVAAAAEPSAKPRNLPAALHFRSSVAEATGDAESMEGRQKVLVFVTDGSCAACLRYEKEYFTDPAVRSEFEDRWLIVKSDTRYDSRVMKDYHLAATDIPLLIVVSEAGNENARIREIPSTPAALARILNDEF